jgi:hypothetical protein
MIGHELRQASLNSAAQAVLSTLSTQWRHSPRFSRPLGLSVQQGPGRRLARPRRRRTPRRCGRLASSAGDSQVARRRFGVTGRANQAAGGAAALGGAAAASLHCQRGEGAASLGGLERRPGRFFWGQRPFKGPAGPMAARFMRPRRRLAHVPTAHQLAPAHGRLGARAGPRPGQSRASLS